MCNEKDCHIRYWSAVIACLIVGLSIGTNLGCDEFLQKGDEIIHDVNDVAASARVLLDSPAGQLIPPDLKLYGLLGIGLANGLIIGWEEWRNRQMKKTAKAIVKGIEQLDNPDKANEIKANITNQMIKQGGQKFYDRANKIVDRLKIE